MKLLLYPIFIVMAFMFWALVVATVLMLYVAAYVVVFLLTLAAMALRLAWRPAYPRRPERLGGTGRQADGATPDAPVPRGPIGATSEAVPQARYSNRR